MLDIDVVPETSQNIRVTKQNFIYDDENKLTDARVERLGMKDLSEANITTYHYEYDPNGNRTLVEIKDDGLTLESTVYTYDRLNKLVRSREVTSSGLYLYEYTYDDNGNLISEDRHRQFETQKINIRRYEYTKDNKLASVYSGNTLLVSYTYDGDGTITSSLERDLDLNQNLNIHDTNYLNSLTNNQRQLINKVPTNDSFLYELTEYVTDKNRPYSETLMERDGTGQLSTVYTYGNQRINSESYNNLTGLYTYDGRGSVSAVIGGYGDFRASYWYDGLGNVKSHVHGYGVFGSGKKYYGYNAEQYNPVTGNQNLRNRQVNIRRQRFLTEDTYLGSKIDILSINRYIYAEDNPLKYKDPNGNKVQYRFVGNDVNNIGYNFVNAVNKDLKDNTSTYGELKNAFAKAKSRSKSYNSNCYVDDNTEIWTYDRIIEEYENEKETVLDVNIDIIKDVHYSRNEYNTYNGGEFPQQINDKIKSWNSGVKANAHQFSRKKGNGRNVKYVDSTGRLEVIYDSTGEIVNDPRDIGTYNFAPSDDDKILGDIPNPFTEQNKLHSQLDVEPWYVWGNTSNDNTDEFSRRASIFNFW